VLLAALIALIGTLIALGMNNLFLRERLRFEERLAEKEYDYTVRLTESQFSHSISMAKVAEAVRARSETARSCRLAAIKRTSVCLSRLQNGRVADLLHWVSGAHQMQQATAHLMIFAPEGPAVGRQGVGHLRWRATLAKGAMGQVSGTDIAVVKDNRIAHLYVML
jgi:hypothetical protein